MERINKISEHPLWKLNMTQLKEAERDRIFCKHGIEHLLDVARIAYIENLEQNCGVSKEGIYAAALLHDCLLYTSTFSMAAQIFTPIFSGFFMQHISYRVLFPYACVFTVLAMITMSMVKHGDSKPQEKKKVWEHFDVED